MTRLTPKGKALRTRGLQAGRQAIETGGSCWGSALRLGIRLAGPLPSAHFVGTLRHAGPFPCDLPGVKGVALSGTLWF